jgi:hypothetical protein
MGHPPRIPVWLTSGQGIIYFLTLCVAGRQKVLANEASFAALKSAVVRAGNKWVVIAAILMPIMCIC